MNMPTFLARKNLIRIATLFVILIAALAIAYWVFAPRQNTEVTQTWSSFNASATKTIEHTLWQEVLDDYLVSDSSLGLTLFDYQGLVDDGTDSLDAYIAQLKNLNPSHYSRDEQFAYWVNLYNALTVKIVTDNYPINSIKEIGNSPLPTGPWNDPAIIIADQTLTLNDIEHSILRPLWKDYRIHFAVNCASIGCPDLQATAFTAQNSEQLLQSASASYINHQRGLSLSGDQLTLSSIFNWYSEDFGTTTSEVLNTLSNHLPNDQAAQLKQFDGQISYDYNWQLNEVR